MAMDDCLGGCNQRAGFVPERAAEDARRCDADPQSLECVGRACHGSSSTNSRDLFPGWSELAGGNGAVSQRVNAELTRGVADEAPSSRATGTATNRAPLA